jgi:hypothetical protein
MEDIKYKDASGNVVSFDPANPDHLRQLEEGVNEARNASASKITAAIAAGGTLMGFIAILATLHLFGVLKGEDGADGDSVTVEALIEGIKDDDNLISKLTGPQGSKGEDGDDGVDGKSVSADELVRRLTADEKFVQLIADTVEVPEPKAPEYDKEAIEKIVSEHFERNKIEPVTKIEPEVPSRAVAVGADAPAPTKYMEEQMLKRDVKDSDVKWLKVGRYLVPVWKTNNRGVIDPSEPPLTKPKGWENSEWVVINGQDWALAP